MKVVNLQQGSPEWLSWRLGGVSASESAIILNRSPYMTPWRLWAEKTGKLPHEDLSKSPLIQRGKRKEDLARRYYEKLHGDDPLLPVCAVSDDLPFMRASFDGLDGKGIPVELKSPHPTTMLNIIEHNEESEAYKLYWVQVQHQMVVAHSSCGVLCFYCDETEGFPPEAVDPETGVAWKIYHIDRDNDFIDNELIPACREFNDRVINGKPPAKDPERDNYVPEPEDFSNWEQHAEQWLQAFKKIERLKKQIAEHTLKQSEASKPLLSMMGDFAHAEACGVHITRFNKAGPANYRAIVEEHLQLTDAEIEKYRPESKPQVRITAVDKGETERVTKARKAAVIHDAKALEPTASESLYNW